MKPYGYASMVRITVGTEEENERFLRALALCLDQLGYR
jgi:histidinol-phosphate/aromatic aminotransferase/cobyric acid decarboxylase-like protein